MNEPTSENDLVIAVQGCCHGELDAIYERLEKHQQLTGTCIDLLICCGDFQSLRNTADYHSLAVPPKYQSMGSFWKYYAGVKQAPFLTLFVGGNHEASQPLQELPYGGWVAPNIYYLGEASVVRYGGVRIGGISGIYKSHDYTLGQFEVPPYNPSTLRSAYHVREVTVERLLCYNDTIDIFVSHDWPRGVAHHGDTEGLLLRKPFFRQEVQTNHLGSPPNWMLLKKLKPRWWFAAHLHVHFAAQVTHVAENHVEPMVDSEETTSNTHASLVPSQVTAAVKQTPPEQAPDTKTSEITSMEKPSSSTRFRGLESGTCNDLTQQMTRFLALDKCLPRRQHLSLLHLPRKEEQGKPLQLEYDLEWLNIVQKTHAWATTDQKRVAVSCIPNATSIAERDYNSIRSALDGTLVISQDHFVRTVAPYQPNELARPRLPRMGNPQTDWLLEKLCLSHITTIPYVIASMTTQDCNEIILEDDDGMAPTGDENKINLEENGRNFQNDGTVEDKNEI
jgi:lariat debranching enzyme